MSNFILRLSVVEKTPDGKEKTTQTKTLAIQPKVKAIEAPHSTETFSTLISLQDNCGAIISQLREKLNTTNDVTKLGPSSNYGLFVPSEPGSKSGVWLDLESPIEKYAREGIFKSGVRKYKIASDLRNQPYECSGYGGVPL